MVRQSPEVAGASWPLGFALCGRDSRRGAVCLHSREGLLRIEAPTVLHLEPAINYRAFLFDPVWGKRFDLGLVKKQADSYQPPQLPSPQDWVLCWSE